MRGNNHQFFADVVDVTNRTKKNPKKQNTEAKCGTQRKIEGMLV